MYTTVNSLMDLWKFVITREIRVRAYCHERIINFLKTLKAADLFNRDTWKLLTVFVKVIPDGDILPTRAKYGQSS
jgi:hypothetical protein